MKSLLARSSPLASPARQLSLLAGLTLKDERGRSLEFHTHLADQGRLPLRATELEIFQINLGKLCNMSCRHCHVDAGPDRMHEVMDRPTVDACLRALDSTRAHTVDLTGGAPEMNPTFEYLVEACKERGKHVIDRCNLSILLVPRYAHLPVWLAERGVEIVSSLPHYRAQNTDAQRGNGAFDHSVEALRLLNAAGYGQGDPKRILTLMSNPAGAYLAGNEVVLEPEWKASLRENFGIDFDRLIVLNNMPISRFLEWLEESGNLERYMRRLAETFNPCTLDGLMCRNTISVSWDGRIFDCDFNQMLDLESEIPGVRIADFDTAAFARRRIRTARHCFGCSAGSGSSCGGAIAEASPREE